MKLISRLLLLAALIALGLWAWSVFFPNPEKLIEKRLVKLSRLVSFSGHEGNFARVATVERISSYFAENVHITLDNTGGETRTFDTREELMQALLAARSRVSSLTVDFTDIHVTVTPGAQSALADLTLHAKVGSQKDLMVEELKVTLQKTDGSWLITRIQTIQPLR